MSLKVHSLGYGVSLLFFGFSCILLGHLIQRSGYLPRAIGTALAAGARKHPIIEKDGHRLWLLVSLKLSVLTGVVPSSA
ncbi:MAG: hypothetical protein Kow001_09120 [Acidobacteriota bacterium]